MNRLSDKRISVKIFITVLIAGIIGIAGVMILKYDIDKLSENYRRIIDEHSVNRSYVSDISDLLYQHQILISNHVIIENENKRSDYLADEKVLRDKMQVKLDEFGERMTGELREQLYHKVYSNYYNYLKNSEIVVELINENSRATAIYYINNTLADFMNKINRDLNELDKLTLSELDDAKEDMEYYMNTAKYSEICCVIVITISMVMCLILCVGLTSGLASQKAELSETVKEKTKVLVEKNKKLIEIQNNIIVGMTNLIENRDSDTGGHIKRISRYVDLLARKAQSAGYCKDVLTDEYIEMLVKAAPMHDIGKIAVPDYILKKHDKLTNEEFMIIERHASEGGRIVHEVLANIEDDEFVELAAEIASSHHEKWNGDGYPVGLIGTDIPISARIMAVADVFDALVSERCYKQAISVDEAFDVIKKSSGTHFDPNLVNLFLSNKKEIKKIFEEFKE